jgi:molecular chaperone DnaK
MTLTRARLEQLTGDLISKTLDPVRRALSDAGMKAGDISEAVMVGGMTRMPAVVEAVRREFGKEPHKGVNPDEVVAIGAAIQAGVLGGEVRGVVLVDVTPLTLSVETLGGVATPIVERNTNIPIRKSQVFSTAADGQTQVEIHVLQGERPMATDNKSLGRFILDGIPPARRGVPQIEVTFEINANGILEVSAKDKATSRSQHITITASSGLSKNEIEKMRQEAESHAEADRQRRDLIEARNHADTVAYTAENALKDAGDKVPAETKKQVEEMIQNVRTAMGGEDIDAIRKAAGDLGDLIQKVGGSLYQQPGGPEQGGPDAQGPQGPQGPSDGNPPQDGDVIDGEYRSI